MPLVKESLAIPTGDAQFKLTFIRANSDKKHYPSSNDNLQSADAYCSSTSSPSPPTWDVFLSFYGKGTRSNFTLHLYSALDQAGILTFRDDPALEKGQEISSGLLEAIKQSKIFIVVVSENHSRSPWCLNELVQILSCKRTETQVIPIFYYVDPSDVRYQKGSFGKALHGHKKRYSVDMIEKWKSTLSEIAALSGHHLRKEANENESDSIHKIVRNVATRASTTAAYLEKYLFGIDSVVEEIYQNLNMESYDVRAIGICGMGGIGKTTIAKAFYNKYVNKFDIGCFSENIEQYSPGVNPLLPPIEQLIIDLLQKRDHKVINVEIKIRKLKQILHSKKALLVLDDLDRSNYSELLASLGNFFSAGSRIIITTRDANLLNKLKMDISEVDTYMVKALGQTESLELFSYHAFRKPVPPESFKELSLKFVTHAGGLPLALKVLGSSLLNRTHESFWKDKLEKVRAIPENEIQKILQLSYDELEDETQKANFLDIAFFFIGEDKDEATDVFKSCDFFPSVGISNLVDRCLLKIDKYNRLQMHNLIRDMGRELGKTTRLFLRGNGWKELQNPGGKNNVEGLILDLTSSTVRQMSAVIFERMSNLRLLQIIGANNIAGSFENLLPKLKCIRWHYCPWTFLPPTFNPENLISIDMSYGKFKRLWKAPRPIKQLNHLSCLYVSECRDLKRLPDQLGEMKALKKIDASYTAIEKLPDSITHLVELADLNLQFCKKLRELPEQVPDSIGLLSKLQALHFEDCKKLKFVPKSIWNLTSVEDLSLHPGETGKISLPDSVKDMNKLKNLSLICNVRLCLPMILRFSSLKKLTLTDDGQVLSSAKPFSLSKLFNLEDLKLDNFTNLGSSLPELPSNLRGLSVFNHNSLEQLPDLSSLENLQALDIQSCISLQSISLLPPHLNVLSVEECTSLQDIRDLSMLKELEQLTFTHCNNLKSIGFQPSCLQAGQPRLRFNADLPNREVAEWFNYKNSGHTVSFEIPPTFGSYCLGLALWVVYTCKARKHDWTFMRAVIRNDKEGITENYPIPLHNVVGKAQSRVECMTGEKLSMKSGDRIKVSFSSSLYNDGKEVANGEVKVKMCGVQVL